MNTLSEPPSYPLPLRLGAVLTHSQHPVFRHLTIVDNAAPELSRCTSLCPAA
jgi:hypothetical protein